MNLKKLSLLAVIILFNTKLNSMAAGRENALGQLLRMVPLLRNAQTEQILNDAKNDLLRIAENHKNNGEVSPTSFMTFRGMVNQEANRHTARIATERQRREAEQNRHKSIFAKWWSLIRFSGFTNAVKNLSIFQNMRKIY